MYVIHEVELCFADELQEFRTVKKLSKYLCIVDWEMMPVRTKPPSFITQMFELGS